MAVHEKDALGLSKHNKVRRSFRSISKATSSMPVKPMEGLRFIKS